MASLPELPVTWSAWANPRTDLYRGTTADFAESILKGGVNRLRGRERTDFGQGFYTTTWFQAAKVWADIKSAAKSADPTALRIALDREALGTLIGIAFIRASHDALDYWNFVSSCRSGTPHRPTSNGWCDVAYGPVAQDWRSPETVRVWPGYDQIRFHTAWLARTGNRRLMGLTLIVVSVVPANAFVTGALSALDARATGARGVDGAVAGGDAPGARLRPREAINK